ncbi:MAG: enoyl-CoA hydratase/isomerase family protein [Deltaproteobacteria bacterium]|nr:enoyl-CoA hydratase/isomerase family protein [Deltaproteobacteria bacterium]
MIIHCKEEGSVWRLRFRAAHEGAPPTITYASLEALFVALLRAQSSDHCRVLILEGEAGEFCRGMDLDDVAGGDPHTHDGVRLYARCVSALREGPFAVVSLVDGPAVAGAVGLVAAADIALATRTSSFALPEVMLGLLPSIVLPLLMERMPEQKARFLALTPAGVSAERAEALGLIDGLCEDSVALEKAARSSIKQLLRLQPAAVGELKRFSRQCAAEPLAEGIEHGVAMTHTLVQQPMTLSAIRAFVAGEPLPWVERYGRDKRDGRGKRDG